MSGNGHTFSGGQSIGKTQGTAPLTLSLSGFPNFGLENLDGIQNHYQPVRFEQIAPNFVSKHVRTFCDDDSAKAGLASDLSPPDLPPLKPLAREGFGVVVMADVSGYSKLTSMLAERGPMGAELLSKTMKGYLDQIIQTVLTHGGDIVKFAGDAVIVYWKIEGPCDGTNISPNDPVSIARGELVVKACYCCLDMLKKLGRYKINIPGCEIEDLQIHLGIGSGQLYDVHVGMTDRWEHFIAGEAVNQLNHVLNAAKPGELAISHQAFKWFSLVIDIETITLGAYNKKYILLNGLEKAQRKIPPSTPTENDDLALWEIASADLNVCLYQKFMNESALYKLQADINQSRLFRIESGLNELLSLYELRQVTTVFIRIGSLQNWNGKTSLADAQQAMAIAQTALKKYEGSLRQFHVDDKGAVMLLFFGLPPLAHENDAIMGLKTGLEICQQYSFLFSEFSIGITTGVISIGGVGNSVRTEYALMGDSINMAARLMFLDAASESILCDERTYNLTERAFVFDSLGEVKVKGKDHPISIFRPKEIRQEAEESNRRFAHDDQLEMIGRSKEKSTVIDAISSVKSGGSEAASIVVIETEGGQGLSTFVKWSKQEIKKRKCLAWYVNTVYPHMTTASTASRRFISTLGSVVISLCPFPTIRHAFLASPRSPGMLGAFSCLCPTDSAHC
ncbi:nucleotide cyclase [Polychytrium aggregatum]|uniref:nucleotide cyclase n=1 Tax=Polychytrium aggregatum TaxID=110093 RepID=UPI0022FE00C6|nr:nucleotide cyclase [Polychytrium aggregatum]KAI9208088.1 nucleotide cyclase [Polychytrium aggregatum]